MKFNKNRINQMNFAAQYAKLGGAIADLLEFKETYADLLAELKEERENPSNNPVKE